MSSGDPAITLRYADRVEELDAVEPMWNALQEHHVPVTPELDPRTPKREPGDARRIRHSKYVRWLEDPETFFVIAEDQSSPVEDMAISGPTSIPTALTSAKASTKPL